MVEGACSRDFISFTVDSCLGPFSTFYDQNQSMTDTDGYNSNADRYILNHFVDDRMRMDQT